VFLFLAESPYLCAASSAHLLSLAEEKTISIAELSVHRSYAKPSSDKKLTMSSSMREGCETALLWITKGLKVLRYCGGTFLLFFITLRKFCGVRSRWPSLSSFARTLLVLRRNFYHCKCDPRCLICLLPVSLDALRC